MRFLHVEEGEDGVASVYDGLMQYQIVEGWVDDVSVDVGAGDEA